MADILHIVSVISFVAAGVFAALAVALWFVFKIPSVMGDLSGRAARKSIERMRQHNEKTGNKSYKTSKENLERGKLTGTMKGIGTISVNNNEETGLLNENLASNYEKQGTGLLIDDSTGLLDDSERAVSLEAEENITIRAASSISIRMIDEVILVHTEEVI